MFSRKTLLIFALISLFMLVACAPEAANDVPRASMPEQPALTAQELAPSPVPQNQEAGLSEEQMVRAAVANIHAMTGNPDIVLNFTGMTTHSENSLWRVAQLSGPEASFLADPTDGRIVYLQYNEVAEPAPGSELTSAQLEGLVRAFLGTYNRCFESAQVGLLASVGGKGANRFFRWQAGQPDPARPNDQPTFVQVSITSDGRIFGYVDSGICFLTQP